MKVKKHYAIKATNAFRRSYKRAKKRGLDLNKLEKIIDLLATGQTLPASIHDHPLRGNWSNYRECHIEPDWLLIYYRLDDLLVLTLVDTGTHADLFN